MSTPDQPSTRVNTHFLGIREMHPGKEYPPHDTRPPRVLAVVRAGVGMLLAWTGSAVESEIASVGQDRLLTVDAFPVDDLDDGVWVWEGRLTRSGVEGELLELHGGWRAASEVEWRRVVAAEHVWEVPPAEPPPTATELLDDVEDALRTASTQLAASRRLVRESQEALDNVRRAERASVRLGNGG